jgi:polyhydroxyalkanoate synthesis regulator phasin
MIGISSSGKEEIGKIVEDMFDRIAMQFIGNVPRLRHKKLLVLSAKPNLNLAHLFVQSMANKEPNIFESDALKSMLESSYGYIESLKNKTRSNVTEQIDGLAKEVKARGGRLTAEDLKAVLDEEMRKAKAHLRTIAEAESSKLRNVGKLMDITRVSSSLGDPDPTVFFVVVKDANLCHECKRLHLMSDMVTPKVWKFSELRQSYHKRSDNVPSAFSLHPHCRCSISFLGRGFGFKNGTLTFISENHDEYQKQHSDY